MTQKIEDALNDCLEQMLKGKSIGACLASHPEQAAELEPLLKISFALTQESSDIQAAHPYKARVLSRLQTLLHARQEKAKRKTGISIWHTRWALAMTGALIVLFAGIGTVAASASALPDSSLYPVKLSAEHARLILAFSDVNRAKLHARFAEHRTAEMVEMARQGKKDEIAMLTERIASHLDKIYVTVQTQEAMGEGAKALAPTPATAPAPTEAETSVDAGEVEELKGMLSQSQARSLAILNNALSKAPEKLKPALQQAIEDMAEDYDSAISLIEEVPQAHNQQSGSTGKGNSHQQ